MKIFSPGYLDSLIPKFFNYVVGKFKKDKPVIKLRPTFNSDFKLISFDIVSDQAFNSDAYES